MLTERRSPPTVLFITSFKEPNMQSNKKNSSLCHPFSLKLCKHGEDERVTYNITGIRPTNRLQQQLCHSGDFLTRMIFFLTTSLDSSPTTYQSSQVICIQVK